MILPYISRPPDAKCESVSHFFLAHYFVTLTFALNVPPFATISLSFMHFYYTQSPFYLSLFCTVVSPACSSLRSIEFYLLDSMFQGDTL